MADRPCAGGVSEDPHVAHVGEWFASLTRADRKQTINALHCYRQLAESNGEEPCMMREIAKPLWPVVFDLLSALERDYGDLKARESRQSADGQPV